jgi:diacylglycerol kinase (ATP)
MKLIRSFKYAFKGLYIATMEEQNFRIHLLAVVVVCVAGALLHLSAIESAIIALTIGVVLAAELFNTAIEDIVNFISPGINEKAGRIKDISAAAVMVTSVTALVIAAFIFGNKILAL